MIIGIAIEVIAITIIMSGITKSGEPQNYNQNATKVSTSSPKQNFALPANYTSIQLVDYCSQNESLVYNDVCIRGLWNVRDECKNDNFSSTNSVCNDSRLEQFEEKVNVYMQNLNLSLTKIVDSCVNVTLDSNISSCSQNIERIQSDCTDPRLFSMWSVCSDHGIEQFNDKFNQTLSKLKS